MKDFVAISISKYLNPIPQNLRKVAQLLFNFLVEPDEVEKYVSPNSSDNCIHHYNVGILNIWTLNHWLKIN